MDHLCYLPITVQATDSDSVTYPKTILVPLTPVQYAVFAVRSGVALKLPSSGKALAVYHTED